MFQEFQFDDGAATRAIGILLKAALFIGLSTQELPHEETTLQIQITVVEVKEHSEI